MDSITVAAVDSPDPEKADYRCNGIRDEVEINASLERPLLKTKLGANKWFREASAYLTQQYRLIEDRMTKTFQSVALDKKNGETFSYEFAGLLRDSCSTFSSVMDMLLRNTTAKAKERYYFGDFRKFLINEVPNIGSRSVTVNDLFPMVIVPFSALRDPKTGLPRWWKAYNNIKHSEATQHRDGNLANALGALAALAILGKETGCFRRTTLFVNVSIVYPPGDPAIGEDRILFDMN